jgi:ABC-type branched-subunit amino acid transport system ATPase component
MCRPARAGLADAQLPNRRVTLFDDRDITNIRPAEVLRAAGIALVPQYRSVFPQMTVQENLTLGL